jgi:hypothetical protein
VRMPVVVHSRILTGRSPPFSLLPMTLGKETR